MFLLLFLGSYRSSGEKNVVLLDIVPCEEIWINYIEGDLGTHGREISGQRTC